MHQQEIEEARTLCVEVRRRTDDGLERGLRHVRELEQKLEKKLEGSIEVFNISLPDPTDAIEQGRALREVLLDRRRRSHPP